MSGRATSARTLSHGRKQSSGRVCRFVYRLWISSSRSDVTGDLMKELRPSNVFDGRMKIC